MLTAVLSSNSPVSKHAAASALQLAAWAASACVQRYGRICAPYGCMLLLLFCCSFLLLAVCCRVTLRHSVPGSADVLLCYVGSGLTIVAAGVQDQRQACARAPAHLTLCLSAVRLLDSR
jgi:hypothetical protein